MYGDPEQSKRKLVWEVFKELAVSREGPWFLSGDFNAMVDNSEKKGGPLRSEWSFVYFRSFLSECDLYDVRHSGNPLSWRGVRHTHVVTCRLDRAVGNSEWAELFPNGRCKYLRFEGSDHRPIITYFALEKKKPGWFRYDRRLKENGEVKKLVEEVWNEDLAGSVQSRIAKVWQALILWNRKSSETVSF